MQEWNYMSHAAERELLEKGIVIDHHDDGGAARKGK